MALPCPRINKAPPLAYLWQGGGFPRAAGCKAGSGLAKQGRSEGCRLQNECLTVKIVCLTKTSCRFVCRQCPLALSLHCVFHSIRFKVNLIGIQWYPFFCICSPTLSFQRLTFRSTGHRYGSVSARQSVPPPKRSHRAGCEAAQSAAASSTKSATARLRVPRLMRKPYCFR